MESANSVKDGAAVLQQVWKVNAAHSLHAIVRGDAEVPGRIKARAQAYVRDAAAIAPTTGDGSYRWIIEQVELALICRLAVQTNGNKSKMARLMGINRVTLRSRMLKLGVIVQ